MKTKLLALALLFVGFSIATVNAQTATPKAKERQINQQKRIHKGAKAGELTKGEYVALQKQQKRIQKSKKQAKADGKVTRRERARIQAQQHNASKNIYRKKNNNFNRN